MKEKVTTIKVEKVFKVCPNCGYKNGFHAMFERKGNSASFFVEINLSQLRKNL